MTNRDPLNKLSFGGRSSLVDEVRRRISDGVYPPGAHLSEPVICREYGVSRTRARECLAQLAAEGFIEYQPYRGSRVFSLSYSRAEQLFDIRASMESLASARCARQANMAQREAVVASVEALETAIAGGNIEPILNAKNQFYEALLDGANNPDLKHMLQILHARIQSLRRYSLSAKGRHVHSLREIQAIRDAILAYDESRAESLAREHVNQAKNVALPILFIALRQQGQNV